MALDISNLDGSVIRDLLFDEVRSREKNKEENSVLVQSQYWADFCDFFRYVYYLPEWELQRIRRHTFHLTSDLYQRYYFADEGFKSLIRNGYAYFINQLGGFEIDEGENGIGVESNSRILSHDLLRYLGALVDLTQSGALDRSEPLSRVHSILEIGGGYGGLARCIQKFKKNIAYVIVDLEETMFFSMCYLKKQLPEKQLYFVNNLDGLRLEPNSVYFVPQHRFEVLEGFNFDLVLSQQSLQEMTADQVHRYLSFIKRYADRLFSCNLSDHGQLAKEKALVAGLEDLLTAELGQPSWIGAYPQEGSFYGDNHLNRRLYRIHNDYGG